MLCLREQQSICECKMNVKATGFLYDIKWTMFHGHLDHFKKSPLEGKPNTKPGDHRTPNAHHCWFILFHHVWGPAWIEIHWKSIWLRARSHNMTSHYTRASVTTLHDFGGVLGPPLDAFFWALTIIMITALGLCVNQHIDPSIYVHVIQISKSNTKYNINFETLNSRGKENECLCLIHEDLWG